jgi:hypothetical protein
MNRASGLFVSAALLCGTSVYAGTLAEVSMREPVAFLTVTGMIVSFVAVLWFGLK